MRSILEKRRLIRSMSGRSRSVDRSRTARLLAASFALACSDDDAGAGVAAAEPARGDLLSLTPLGSLAPSEVATYLAGFDIDTASVRYGVDAYRIEYRTLNPDGALVRASGLIALPSDEVLVPPRAIWMHGTTVYRGEVASLDAESDSRAAAYFFAAGGYATTAPDYVGLGLGEGPHPYDHLPSEVSAGVDASIATDRAAEQLARELAPSVSISGHSQGGPASVALAREIETGPGRALQLAAVAPISGPYDMSGSLAIAAQGGIAFVTAYLGYLTVAWNRWLGLYATPSEAFLPPYDQTLETLFDNEHTVEEVFAGLPETLDELFTPVFLDRLRNPTGPLRAALEEASQVCAWRPEASVTVYASSADADVPIANAHHCVDSFRQHGAQVPLVDWVDADHSTSMTLSLPLALAQFERAALAR